METMDTIVAHTHPFVIGVDTHARTHTYAASRRQVSTSEPKRSPIPPLVDPAQSTGPGVALAASPMRSG